MTSLLQQNKLVAGRQRGNLGRGIDSLTSNPTALHERMEPCAVNCREHPLAAARASDTPFEPSFASG